MRLTGIDLLQRNMTKRRSPELARAFDPHCDDYVTFGRLVWCILSVEEQFAQRRHWIEVLRDVAFRKSGPACADQRLSYPSNAPGAGSALNSGDKPAESHARPYGPLRRFLKLIVEIDSSRFALSRLKAALMLLAILALFAGLGYGLPALFSRYF
ncbi:hypothetical protein [Bosea sp. PAMC 26642]|uniref:hypothetical protein n=1 Tax=Bosea sp. (strain PAMC 26642) TaxID=1792307 RepID=UPI0012E929E0|nr:hypothetical protein [Bosea sp. PAMC 26642]